MTDLMKTLAIVGLMAVPAGGCALGVAAGAGYTVAERRWRGPGGEIDLILRGPEELVFVEVKHSSRGAAALRITPRQVERIYASAGQYLENEPQGQLTPVRFDAALVDGSGAVEIIENAFGMG